MVAPRWQEFFDQKIRLLSESKQIIDVGGAQPFQKELAPYTSLFKSVRCDCGILFICC